MSRRAKIQDQFYTWTNVLKYFIPFSWNEGSSSDDVKTTYVLQFNNISASSA
jgi:hypothetical protein